MPNGSRIVPTSCEVGSKFSDRNEKEKVRKKNVPLIRREKGGDLIQNTRLQKLATAVRVTIFSTKNMKIDSDSAMNNKMDYDFTTPQACILNSYT